MKRSDFLRLLLLGATTLPAFPSSAMGKSHEPAAINHPRPNFLWIIAEDTGPWLGCYGNTQVRTPHLDALAARGLRFTNAWAGGPVCSASRSSLFTGMYAPALGTDTHREERPIPPWAFFTPSLREAGYYCTNNAKTDYNISNLRADAWDANGPQAHYKDRPAEQPFFHCYSSLGQTHMARIVESRPEKRSPRRISPDAIKLPRALPNEPLLRDDRAWHLDALELMDAQVGRVLGELKASGAAEDTIVFFFSDHGGCLPNGKGYASEWGFHVPLIVYFPEKFAHLRPRNTQPGGTCEQLVSFLDFAPTLLSLAGIPTPNFLQGQAFAGARAAIQAREHLYGFRGLSGGPDGARWDVVRTVRDARYLYTRNFLPHRAPGLRQDYHARMPGQQAWEQAWRDGRCDELQSRFWQPKPVEEFYDLQADPEQTRNLIADPAQTKDIAALRARLSAWLEEIQDIGLTPNSLRSPEAFASYYDRMRAAPDLRRAILAAALRASAPDLQPEHLTEDLHSPHPVVRYWAASGLTRLAYQKPTQNLAPLLRPLLSDSEPWVRVAAAEASVALGDTDGGLASLLREIETHSPAASEACAAIETLGPRAATAGEALQKLHHKDPTNFYLRSALVTLDLMPLKKLFPSDSL
jgi:arylsulfatase A-like enzyme